MIQNINITLQLLSNYRVIGTRFCVIDVGKTEQEKNGVCPFY